MTTSSQPVNSLLPSVSNDDPDAVSSRDWSFLLSSDPEDKNGDGIPDWDYDDNTPNSSSDGKDGQWVLIVGILLIVLAVGGIGYVIYSTWFQKPKNTPPVQPDGDDFTDLYSDSDLDPDADDDGIYEAVPDDGEDYGEDDAYGDLAEDSDDLPGGAAQDAAPPEDADDDDDDWKRFFKD